MAKKKQDNLPGMPPPTQLEKDAEIVVEKWEDLQEKKAALTAAKKKLLETMKATKRFVVSTEDSKGILRKMEYKDNQAITIVKDTGPKGKKGEPGEKEK